MAQMVLIGGTSNDLMGTAVTNIFATHSVSYC